ncbi:glycosyltransferase family 4 protein [Halogeometricum luteum]|uniref:Glycosyltransferase family 4 protein n=1 Tax=Halogeometricum luteum TaxID=2950537 RepID=A0ABU2G3J0_9EURY|nr:glycosyltransferase family 4 protein [Halogeometricum sp. S3BR5-2]MDS0295349.1 glycosyltransferase family 4 protein [Halogeometricum sp. S3BR5-2]
MQVLFIANKLNMAGAGSNVSLDTIARGLSSRGHQVDILTTNVDMKNVLPDSHPYSVKSLRSTTFEDILKEIRNEISSGHQTPDIIHVFAPIISPILGYYRMHGGQIPVVGRLNSYTMFCTNNSLLDGECHKNCSMTDKIRHDDSSTKKKIAKLPFYAYSAASFPSKANYIDKYFAQSPSISKYYQEAGIESERICVISNFYNESFYQGPQVRPTRGDWSQFNILYVGRLEPEKNVSLLLRAACELPLNHTMHIVGDGSEYKKIQNMVSELNVQDKIALHGWVDHDKLPAYYSNSDIYVHPGQWPEPSGRAVLEALQYDCPIVASDIGGPQWIKGDAGSTFKSNDCSDLTEKILCLSQDKVKYQEKKEKCSNRLQDFSPKTVMDRIEQEYRSLT